MLNILKLLCLYVSLLLLYYDFQYIHVLLHINLFVLFSCFYKNYNKNKMKNKYLNIRFSQFKMQKKIKKTEKYL